jgi:hypothetical protein
METNTTRFAKLENILNIQSNIEPGFSSTTIEINNLKYDDYIVTNPQVSTFWNVKNVSEELNNKEISSEKILAGGNQTFTNTPFDLFSNSNVNLNFSNQNYVPEYLNASLSNETSRLMPNSNDYSIIRQLSNVNYLHIPFPRTKPALNLSYDNFGIIENRSVILINENLEEYYYNNTSFFLILQSISPIVQSICIVEYEDDQPLRNRMYFNRNVGSFTGSNYTNQPDQTTVFSSSFNNYCILPFTKFRINIYGSSNQGGDTGILSDIINFSFSSFSILDNVFNLAKNNYYLTSNELQYGSSLNGNIFYSTGSAIRIRLKYGLFLPILDNRQSAIIQEFFNSNSSTNVSVYIIDKTNKYICTNIVSPASQWDSLETNGVALNKRFNGNYVFFIFRNINNANIQLNTDNFLIQYNQSFNSILVPSFNKTISNAMSRNSTSYGFYSEKATDVVYLQNSPVFTSYTALDFNSIQELLNYTFSIENSICILTEIPIEYYIENLNLNGLNYSHISNNCIYFFNNLNKLVGKLTGKILSNGFVRIRILKSSNSNQPVLISTPTPPQRNYFLLPETPNSTFILNGPATLLNNNNYLVSPLSTSISNITSVYVQKIYSPCFLIQYNAPPANTVNKIYNQAKQTNEYLIFEIPKSSTNYLYKIGYYSLDPRDIQPGSIQVLFNQFFKNVTIPTGYYSSLDGVSELNTILKTLFNNDVNITFSKFTNKNSFINSGSTDYFLSFTDKNSSFNESNSVLYGFENSRVQIAKNNTSISPIEVDFFYSGRFSCIKVNLLNMSNFGFINESLTLIKLIAQNNLGQLSYTYLNNFRKLLPRGIILSNINLEITDNNNLKINALENINISFTIDCYNSIKSNNLIEDDKKLIKGKNKV